MKLYCGQILQFYCCLQHSWVNNNNNNVVVVLGSIRYNILYKSISAFSCNRNPTDNFSKRSIAWTTMVNMIVYIPITLLCHKLIVALNLKAIKLQKNFIRSQKLLGNSKTYNLCSISKRFDNKFGRGLYGTINHKFAVGI